MNFVGLDKPDPTRHFCQFYVSLHLKIGHQIISGPANASPSDCELGFQKPSHISCSLTRSISEGEMFSTPQSRTTTELKQ